ncbi:MAG: homocysteine S-methyltransferase family protein [Amylibacter sp.]|nr:homocysteine S-methyltransferase family protein [Amylibacter sp.]
MSITILDGGMGQELIARAGRATSLWSVPALLDNPEMVRAVHDEYFAAGAEIATTNTYSVLPDRLVHHGLSDRLTLLQQLACQQAVDARDAHGSGLVAGSLGPLGFSYQPDKSPPAEEAAEIYRNICQTQKGFVDHYLFETMSSIDQARGALMGSAGLGKPVWLSLSVDDKDGSKLRSGENLTDILPLLAEYKPAAVLVNCSVPEAVTAAVPLLTDQGIPVGAYANGFVSIADTFDHVGATVDELETRKDLGPEAYADFAQNWADAGATIIGGCCEVGPAHIALLAQKFSEKRT